MPIGVAAGRHYGSVVMQCDADDGDTVARGGVVADLLLDTLTKPLSAEGLEVTVSGLQIEYLLPVPLGVVLTYAAWRTQRLGLHVSAAVTLYSDSCVYAQATGDFVITLSQ